MIIKILFSNTGQFAITVFSFFTFFSVGLLYLDSWQVDKQKKTTLFRGIGFFLLAVVAAIHASSISLTIITTIAQVFKISGLALILSSLIKEPILSKPKTGNISEKADNDQPIKIALKKIKRKTDVKMAMFVPFIFPAVSPSLIPLSAILMLLISLWYFRKSTEGFEKQLRPVGFAFLFLALAEFVNISFFWSNTINVFWSKVLADFGAAWATYQILELIGILILLTWTWGYIRFKLQTQLFATIVASTLIVFLVTTFFFTFLLLKNLENDALDHLKTDVNVLQYALNSLQLETLSHAKAIAQDSNFREAFGKNNLTDLYNTTSNFMIEQNTSFLTIASSSGEVVMRAEDRERVGDNISENPVVKSALSGQLLSTIVSNEGITSPEVLVESAVPIKNGGVVITGFNIDSAFVDGVKDVTGLDIAVFGGNVRAATTFIAPDGKSRFVGTLETNEKITNTVLRNGEIYIGASSVLNQPYYTAYAPLKTLGDETIGMLFVGKPQTTLLNAAQKSIDLTFLGSVVLMMLSIIPAYFLSKYINEHVSA